MTDHVTQQRELSTTETTSTASSIAEATGADGVTETGEAADTGEAAEVCECEETDESAVTGVGSVTSEDGEAGEIAEHAVDREARESTAGDDCYRGRTDDSEPDRIPDVQSDAARDERQSAGEFAGTPSTGETGAASLKSPATDERANSRRRSSALQEPDEFRQWVAETATVLADADCVHIDVYLRSMLPPPGAKDAQLNVLNTLSVVESSTQIDDVSVTVWGERICLCEQCQKTETGQRMVDAVRRFRHWGVEYGASTERFFERTQQQSSVVGSAHEGIAPPRVTTALVADGSIQGVFPARFGDDCYSVHDFSEIITRLLDDDRRAAPVE